MTTELPKTDESFQNRLRERSLKIVDKRCLGVLLVHCLFFDV
jgi:hypothetical protein